MRSYYLINPWLKTQLQTTTKLLCLCSPHASGGSAHKLARRWIKSRHSTLSPGDHRRQSLCPANDKYGALESVERERRSQTSGSLTASLPLSLWPSSSEDSTLCWRTTFNGAPQSWGHSSTPMGVYRHGTATRDSKAAHLSLQARSMRAQCCPEKWRLGYP